MNPVHDVFPTGIDLKKSNYSHTELQALVENDVTNCGKKSVFISSLESVSAEKDFLSKKYPSKEFHTGHRLLNSKRCGWWGPRWQPKF